MSGNTDPSLRLPLRRLGKRRIRHGILSSWYGEERADVEIAAHTCEPQPISTLLDQVLTRIDRPENGILIRLRADWSKISGSAISRFSTPLELKDGTLILAVRHSAMIPELQQTSDLILKQIAKTFGNECCREIRFTVEKAQQNAALSDE